MAVEMVRQIVKAKWCPLWTFDGMDVVRTAKRRHAQLVKTKLEPQTFSCWYFRDLTVHCPVQMFNVRFFHAHEASD